MKLKFFYFDLGKVLVDFDVRKMYQQMAEASGVDAERVKAVLFDGGLQMRYEAGQITSEEFYREFCRQTGNSPDYDALERAGSDIFTLRASMLPVVAQMQQAGHRLGILSNTCASHWAHCLRSYCVLSELFPIHALSFRIKHSKPEAAIYQAAARLAGVEPGEIFFVDDQPGHVQGARAVGFDAVQYTSTTELVEALRGRGVRFNY